MDVYLFRSFLDELGSAKVMDRVLKLEASSQFFYFCVTLFGNTCLNISWCSSMLLIIKENYLELLI